MYRRVRYRDGSMAVVLVAVAVTLASSTRTPTYEASAQVRVDQKQGDQQMELANQAGSGEMIKTLPPSVQGLQTIILTMIHTIHTRPVAEETTARLGLRMEPAELLDNLTVEQVENTNFIRLRYEDTDPERATQIVNTVGEVSSELISERSSAGSQLTAAVFDKAAVPESPVGPHPWRNGLLTLVVGWTLTGLVILAHRTERRKP